jgi:gluconokinase
MNAPSAGKRKTAVVVMGVAGTGKSTVGQILARRLGWSFAEADDFHSAANVAKMASGTPLTDEDRRPWLESIRTWIDANAGDSVVTCSALRRSYRDILRGAQANVRFLHLSGTQESIGARMAARTSHFMPTSLLASQLATLEPLEGDEDGVVINITGTPEEIVTSAVKALGLRESGDGLEQSTWAASGGDSPRDPTRS